MSDKRAALVIASSQFDDEQLSQLMAPTQDVKALAQVLEDPDIGGFEVKTIINKSSYEVMGAIEDFFADRKPNDLILLYFSGHGVKDQKGRLYYATPNTNRRRLLSTAIPATIVNDIMLRSRSRKQVLILDCCHSGAFAKGMIARADEAIGSRVGINEQLGGRGRFVLTASDALEYAFEGDDVRGEGVRSVFTTALVQGLSNGDADRDGDGNIDLDELYDYVYEQVKRKTPLQNPEKWDLGLRGKIFVAKNPNPVISPAELPPELQEAIADPLVWKREGAVIELKRLLQSNDKGLALAARTVLEQLSEDDSRRVSNAALRALGKTKSALPTVPVIDSPTDEETSKRVVGVKPEEPSITREKEKRQIADLERRLEKNYLDGLNAYWIDDWVKAKEYFSAVLAERPDYKNTAVKLSEIENELTKIDLYERAQNAIDGENWSGAKQALDKLVAVDLEYKDAKSKLDAVNKRLKLNEYYNQALQLFQAEKWQAVIGVFDRIDAIESGYDPKGLLAVAKQTLAEQELAAELDDLYRHALGEMNAERWEAAQGLLEQVKAKDSQYRDLEKLLHRVQQEIKKAALHPSLAVSVRALKPTVKVGEEAIWEVVCHNDGDEDLNKVLIKRRKTILSEIAKLPIDDRQEFSFSTRYRTEGEKTVKVVVTCNASKGVRVLETANGTILVKPPIQETPSGKLISQPETLGKTDRNYIKSLARSNDPENTIDCPYCSASVKAKNLVRHFDKNHSQNVTGKAVFKTPLSQKPQDQSLIESIKNMFLGKENVTQVVRPTPKKPNPRNQIKSLARSKDPESFIECPYCSASVKTKNLVKHYDRNH